MNQNGLSQLQIDEKFKSRGQFVCLSIKWTHVALKRDRNSLNVTCKYYICHLLKKSRIILGFQERWTRYQQVYIFAYPCSESADFRIRGLHCNILWNSEIWLSLK